MSFCERYRAVRIWFCLFIGVISASLCRAQNQIIDTAQNLPLLTNAVQVRALSQKEAKRGYPVRLRGVVTFYNQKTFQTCFIQDSTGGIYVRTKGHQFVMQFGEMVEMQGFSMQTDFAPAMSVTNFVHLGKGQVPFARPVSFEQIATGTEDAQWVELGGIVRAVSEDKAAERLVIEIATDGHRWVTRVRDYDPNANYEPLIDARVRIRGVCAMLYNQNRQMFNVRLLVPGMDQVLVTEPAPADPFATPVRPINSLLQFSPMVDNGRRAHVQGVVMFHQMGRALFIRDKTQALFIRTSDKLPVQPGDIVDVVGFPTMGEWTPTLQDATFRKIGVASPPVPVVTTAQKAFEGTHDADLVQLEATILDREHRLTEEILVLQSSNLVFNAHLDKTGSEEALSSILKGSKVRVTGICLVQVVEQRAPQAFQLMLRSPADVILLRGAPWWTLTHLLWILAGLALVVMTGSIWVIALRKRVREQTQIIREKVEREATLEERTRLAREFHDTLEQQLTGIRLQLDAVKTKFKESPEEAEGYLNTARSLIRHSHAEARRSVWDLRADLLEAYDLPAALTQIVNRASVGAPLRSQVTVYGTPHPLDNRVEKHLLRIGQEAVTNALKHAQAKEILVELHYDPTATRLRIRDDGRGFDTASPTSFEGHGHFGLLGMKERAEQFGGCLNIVSGSGRGTLIEVTVPSSRTAPVPLTHP